MACITTINEEVNRIIDDQVTIGKSYEKSDANKLSDELNSIWKTNIVNPIRLKKNTYTIAKNLEGISLVSNMLFDGQTLLERKLSNQLEPTTLEQRAIINNEFIKILNKYKANSIGVIESNNITFDTYQKLQNELNNSFGDLYTVRVQPNKNLYVSLSEIDNNVFLDEANKAMNKGLSNSILSNAGVESSSVMLVEKFSKRFNSNIKIVSAEQAEKLFPGLRSSTTGFYKDNISYLILERLKPTTTLHEGFSHPFINYIHSNHNGLYRTLLEKAKANQGIAEYVEKQYPDYNPLEKEMEYIARALDLEYENSIKDASLLKSIALFWKRILDYIKSLFGTSTDLSKFTTFKEVIDFALNSNEKLDLTNTQLMNLSVMEDTYEEREENLEEELNDEGVEMFTEFRKENYEMMKKVADWIDTYKQQIRDGKIILDDKQVLELDTFTARINALSYDLNKNEKTRKLIIEDKYLSAALTMLRDVAKRGSSLNQASDEISQLLSTISSISQILEEGLILSSFVKKRISDVDKSSQNLAEKQKQIIQYHNIMQALKSSLKSLDEFFINSKDVDSNNPVTKIILEINSNIDFAEKINDKVVVDHWAIEMNKAFDKLIGTKITDAVKKEESKLERRVAGLKASTNEKEKEKIRKEIFEINQKILKMEGWKPTIENIKKTIKGELGDSSYLKYLFDAAFNSEDMVVAGVATIIEKVYMKKLDSTQIKVNQIANLLDRFIEATGQSRGSKANLSEFFSPIIQKVEFKRLKSVQKKIDVFDEETNTVTTRTELQDEMVDVVEDQLIAKFQYAKLQEQLDLLLFDIKQARKTGTQLDVQKAIKVYSDFKRTYFITSLTEEFEKRIMNSNLLTEADLAGLKDKEGNPLSLKTNPNLALAAKEVLEPLYDAKSEFYKNTRTSDKTPTTAEINEFEEINQKIRSIGSLYVHGTSKLKTGIDLAIARAVIRSKDALRGVYSYKPGAHSTARWEQRLAEITSVINEGVKDGTITREEGDERLHNWHRLNSKVEISKDFYRRKSNIIKNIDSAFKNLSSEYSFIEKFIDTDKDSLKRDTLRAFWGEVYDPMNSLKDLEGIVNGNIADESLQKTIKELIESIEIEQKNNSAVLNLTNKSDLMKFDNAVREISVKIPASNGLIPIKAFDSFEDILDALGNPMDTSKKLSVLSFLKKYKYNSGAEEVIKNTLKSLETVFDDETTLRQVQRYIFLNTEYAKMLSIKIKNSLKNSTNSPSENTEELYRLLDEELSGILDQDFAKSMYYENNKDPNKGFGLTEEEQKAYEAIILYNKEVGEYFGELSKMSQRIPTSYYVDTVNARKEAIVREFINTEIKDIIFKNVDSEDPDSIDYANKRFEMVKIGNYKSIPIIKNFVDNKFVESDWYKQNHYKKKEVSNGTMIESDFPTPLWTQSSPVNNEYMKVVPGSTYSKRSINEFLLDENGDPTNIRLKRTDIDDKFFGYMTPKETLDDGTESPFIDQRYKALTKTNPKLIEVLDELTNLYLEAQEMSGVKGLHLKLSLPRMEAEKWEVFLEGGKQIAKKIRKSIKNKFTVTEQDKDYGYGYGDFEDRFTESVPVKFLADIPYELRSRDVFGNIVEFIAQAHLISGLNELYPSAKELHKIVDKNTPAVTRESNIVYKTFGAANKKLNDMIKVPLRGLENIRAEHIQHLIKTKILNARRRELHLGNFSITKTLDGFSSLTSYGSLAGIIRPNIVMNYLVGKVQTWLEVWSNGLINREDYNTGLEKLYRYFATDFSSDFYKFGNKSIMGQLLIRYNTQSKDLFEIFGQELKRTPLKDIISSEILFKTRRLSEFELSNSVVLALLTKVKVLDGDIQIPLLEAYYLDDQGNIKLKEGIKSLDGTNFTEEDEERMRIKAMSANLIIQGNYSKHNITKFDTTVLGPQVSFFRKHLMSYYNKAWGEEQMHYGLGEIVEGYNRKLLKTIWNMAKNILDSRARKDIWEDFKLDKKETNTYQKAFIHNGLLMLIYALLALLDGDDDDPEKANQTYDSFLIKSMVYQLMRLKSDLELNSLFPFFAGLDEAMGIYKNPSITVSKTGMEFYKIFGDIKDYAGYKLGIVDEEDVVIDRDYYMYKKGDLKLLKDLGKLMGITGSTFNPDQMVDKLENLNKTLYR